MNFKNKPAKTIIAVLLLSTLTSFALKESTDVFDVIPSESLLCLRINNFDETMARTDQFLMGISPMGPSMLIKMQMAQMLGDPMLKGVDTAGDFALFAMPVQAGLNEEKGIPFPQMVFAVAVPVDREELLKNNSNFSVPDADGIITLKTPNATTKELAALPALRNYMIMTQPGNRDMLLTIREKTAQSTFVKTLDMPVVRQAESAPLWFSLNVELLNKIAGSSIKDQLEKAKAQMEVAMSAMGKLQQQNMIWIDMYLDIIKNGLEQTRMLTLELYPKADSLSLTKSLYALPGSDMFGFLMPDTAAGDFSMAGLVSEPAAMNFLIRTNKKMWKKTNEAMLDLMAESSPKNELSEKIRDYSEQWLDITGDEMAFSFSYTKGMPPIEFAEFIKVTDAKKAETLFVGLDDFINEFYTDLGLNAKFRTNINARQYKGVDIHTAKVDFELEGIDPNSPEYQQMKMFTGDGLAYDIAVVKDILMMNCAPAKEKAGIQKLIDKIKTGSYSQPSGDIQTALGVLGDTSDYEIVGSLNVLTLITGMNEMLSAMPGAAPAAAVLSKIPSESKSCIALAGDVETGGFSMKMVLPKEHLLEMVSAFNTIQQQQKQIEKERQTAE